MSNLYANAILPQLLKNKMWYKDVGDTVTLDTVVLFKKKTGSNFVQGWSMAYVTKLNEGKDGKVRSVEIEYVGTKDDTEMTEAQNAKTLPKRRTTRDIGDLIILFPVCSTLDTDLRVPSSLQAGALFFFQLF